MKLRYLRAFIVLLAGLITLIINIKTQREVTKSLIILLVVLLFFYVLGTLVVELIQQSLEKEQKKKQQAAALDETFDGENIEEDLEGQQEEDVEKEEPHVFFDEDEM